MHVYKQGDQFLIVLGDIPQWFIVDQLGLNLTKKIIANENLEKILMDYPCQQRKEIRQTYDDLYPLVFPPKERDAGTIENALTTKTTVAMVSVTHNCNLKAICPHCYIDADDLIGNELSVNEHQWLASAIKSSLASDPTRTYRVNLTGGEPFFHRKIIRIIEAYRKVGLEVSMSTNGLLIKDRDIQTLSDLGVILSVSLDGSCSKTHDAVRGKGSWQKVTNKISKLTAAGVKVGINCLVYDANFSELEDVVTLSHNLGCSGFNPINLVQLGRACRSGMKRVPEVEIFRRLAAHLTLHPDHQHLFDSSSLFSSLGAALQAGVVCESCGIGNRPCVYVTETGLVYPCPNTQRIEFLLGDIRKQPLADCVKLSHPVLSMLRELRVDTLNPKCSACDIRYFCGGDCRGETQSVTGDLHAPYVACKDRHDSIIELMWITAEHPEFFDKRANEYITNIHS